MPKYSRLIILNQMSGPLSTELAESLVSDFPDGVFLVTGHPNCLHPSFQERSRLHIHKSIAYNKRSYLFRIYSWFSYLFTTTKVVLQSSRTDLFLAFTNPPILFPYLFFLRFFKKFECMAFVYDIYPNVLVKLGYFSETSLFVKVWESLNSMFYSQCISIFTLGSCMRDVIAQQSSLSPDSIFIVPPWSDTSFIKPIPRHSNLYASKFVDSNTQVVLYAGNLGASHEIDTILNSSKHFSFSDQIEFLFVGDGAYLSHLTRFIQLNPDTRVSHYPLQEYSILPSLLSLADISIVSLQNGFENLMLPSKLFSYMSAGSCIVAICHPCSELAHIVTSSNCGLVVQPGNSDELASTIKMLLSNHSLLNQFKRSARNASLTFFTLQSGVHSFKKCYDLL